MSHPFVHLEIPADNIDRAREFYSRLFDWELTLTPQAPDYWLFSSGDDQCRQGGAVMNRQYPDQVPVVYFDVDSIDAYVDRIQSLGGQILLEKLPVPGMGWLAQFKDPEGNVLALWQADMNAA